MPIKSIWDIWIDREAFCSCSFPRLASYLSFPYLSGPEEFRFEVLQNTLSQIIRDFGELGDRRLGVVLRVCCAGYIKAAGLRVVLGDHRFCRFATNVQVIFGCR